MVPPGRPVAEEYEVELEEGVVRESGLSGWGSTVSL